MVRRLLFAMGLAVTLGACGYAPSFVKSGYDDFTSYFNSFYNAEAAFSKGRRGLEKNKQPIDRTTYLALFPVPAQTGNKQSFKKAIDKSAGILREHPNSRWVDDALLLIGKSYFYLQNYVGAEQKFQEVLALGEGRAGEANFWLARTFSASGAYEEGIEHLQSALQREGLTDTWEPRLHLVLGQLYVRQGAWEKAIQELEKGLENAGGRTLEARAHFLLGQLYEKTEHYEDAIQHYRASADRRPRYQLTYAAQFSAIRVQGLHGNAQRALQLLRDMERDDKNYENRGELAYLRGRIEQAQGHARQAERQYRDVLYHSDANISDVRPRIHYALGTLYRDVYHDYVAAAAHFDTVTTSMGKGEQASEVTEIRRRSPGAISNAQELSEQFGAFAEVRNRISRMDSLLKLGKLNEEEFRKRILEIQRKKARAMAEQRRAQNERQRQQVFNQAGAGRQENQRSKTAAQSAGEAGFLFHENPIRVQQAKVEFRQQWGDRPLVENWRRLSAVTAVADEQAETGGGVAPDSMGGSGVRATLPSLDLSSIPRDKEARSLMIERLAQARYELGNVLFLQMQQPDSAAAWYRRVIVANSDQPVANRAYYALAEVQRARGDTAFARELYQKALRRDPDDKLAGRLRRRLGRVQTTHQRASQDTLALASAAYAEGYATWQQERFADAIPQLLKVADRYPNTPEAPKAMLAAGQAALQWTRRDSLALAGKLPLPLSDSLHRVLNLQEPSSRASDASPGTLAADTLATDAPAADSLAADTLAQASRDSLATGDSLAASLPPAEPDTLTITTFYEALTERYPQTKEAARAQAVLDALREKIVPPPDSSASTEPADTSSAPPATLKKPVPGNSPPSDTTLTGKQPVRKNKRNDKIRSLRRKTKQSRADSTKLRRGDQILQVPSASPDSVRTDSARKTLPKSAQ